jgi:phage portal protein BeeE
MHDAEETFATTLGPSITSPEQVAAFLSGWGSDIWDTGDFATEPVISRAAAITVPAVAAGRDLVVNTLAPLELDLRKGDVSQPIGSLLQRPDPRFTRYEWMAWVLDDLVFEGESICRISARGWDGYPSALERLDPLDLRIQDDCVMYEGGVVKRTDLIRFGLGGNGIRYSGRRVLRTALRLEQAARIDAETPIPTLILENLGPDLDTDQVTSLLTAWRTYRQAKEGGVGYTNQSIKATPLSASSAAERQLVEGRRYLAVEIARLMGLDASDLDAAMSGSSVTYQNTVSQVKNRLQRLAGYRAAIEQRFSMPDLTPRGYTVRLDTDEIATDEMATRYQAYSTAISAGFLTVDEVRALEGREPTTPAPTPTTPTPGETP